MWWSRLRLHPRDPLVLRDLGDPVELHRSVMRGFGVGEGSPRAEFQVLHRLERSPQGDSAPVLLVQSGVEPDWRRLPEGYLLGHETRDASSLLDGVAASQVYRFRVVANASKKVGTRGEDGRLVGRSRRVPLRDDTDRLAWLDRRASGAGFVVEPGSVRIDDMPTMAQRGPAGVVVEPVGFSGLLRVVDPVALSAALRGGIGPAKAYGCGLLTIAPPR
jgi:CRISPR system Cascade subunit CasE